MSDPEVPKNEQPHDVDDVVSRANEGLDAAAAARGGAPGADDAPKPAEPDPDLEAFAAAERDYPGTFGSSDAGADAPVDADAAADTEAARRDAGAHAASAGRQSDVPAETEGAAAPGGSDSETTVLDTETAPAAADAAAPTDVYAPGAHSDQAPAAANDRPWARADDAPTAAYDAPTRAYDTTPADDAATVQYAAPTVADTAYGAPSAAETAVVPAEPVAPPAAPQPIFVQAPEPPRELGNRGAAGGIGLVAALCFAILYLGATLGLGALAGDVTLENIGAAALTAVQTWAFWVPVVVFFLCFWLLGAFVNRARWGVWVILGLLVAAGAYGGHILGQLFQAPFWSISGGEIAEIAGDQLLAPLAIGAFIFARELTIWFGAWVARSGAKKKALNAEAQAEYERTLEAGPAAMRSA